MTMTAEAPEMVLQPRQGEGGKQGAARLWSSLMLSVFHKPSQQWQTQEAGSFDL